MIFFRRGTDHKVVTGPLIARGDAARDRGDWIVAAEAYKEALDLRPELANIWIQYSHALKEAGRHGEAVAAYQQALQLKPDDAETHIHLAHLLKRMKQFGNAIMAFEKALDLTPHDASLYEEIATLKGVVDQLSDSSAQLTVPVAVSKEESTPDDRASGILVQYEPQLKTAQTLYEIAQSKNEVISEQITAQQAELEAPQAQILERASDLDGLGEQVRKLKQSRDTLVEERNAAQNTVERVKAEADQREKSAAARLAATQRLYEEAQSENELFKEQIAGQQAELESQQARLVEMASDLDGLREQVRELKQSRDTLFEERNAAKNKVWQVRAEADEREKSAAARLTATQRLYEEARGENELLRQQIAGQQAELEAQQAQLVGKASDLDRLRDQIHHLKQSHDTLLAERKVEQNSLGEIKAEANEREKSAAARLAATQMLYEEAQGENELFREQIAGQQAELEAQQGKASELTTQVAEMKIANESLFQERNAARAKIDSLTSTIAELEAARDQALVDAEMAHETAHEYETRVGKAREELLRSEGQLTLIKDLVLWEGEL